MSITASPKHNLNISDGTDPDASDRPSPHSPTMKAKSGTSDQIPKPLFMTGTGTTISGKKGDEKIGKMEDVMNYHDKLNRYIEQLDNKVKNRLHDNQTSFLMAYKEQMTIIQRELALLKKKVDEETYRRKNDERMNILEQERNWFRAEAIRLDQACKEQQRLIDELRFKLKIVTEDKGHFEDFVLAAKKENKALKEELEQLEQTRKNYEDTNFIMQSPPQGKLLPSNLRRGQLTGSSKRGLASRKNMLIEGNENFQPNLGELSDSQQNKSANEEKLSEIIKQLKADLDKEKKITRQLRNEKSQMLVNRIELEQILVESINEVKKDISRRRSAKTYKDLDKGPVVSQDVDIAKFSATDKKNLLEYFLSNEAVLDELYNLVFNNPNSGPRVNTVPDLDKGQTLNHNLHTSNSTRSDTKMKYTFNYDTPVLFVNETLGFGSTANLKLGPKDLENFGMSQRTHALVGEIKRDVKRSDPKKEL